MDELFEGAPEWAWFHAYNRKGQGVWLSLSHNPEQNFNPYPFMGEWVADHSMFDGKDIRPGENWTETLTRRGDAS